MSLICQPTSEDIKQHLITTTSLTDYLLTSFMLCAALPPSTVVNATAIALSPTEIHVHWRPPERGVVTRYQIRYWRPGKRDKQSAWLKAPTTDYVAGENCSVSQCNPFAAPACTISGLKDARVHLQIVYFPVLWLIYFRCLMKILSHASFREKRKDKKAQGFHVWHFYLFVFK